MIRLLCLLAAVAVCLQLVACSTAAPGPVQACIPGATNDCSCVGGLAGVQSCQSDGKGFNACVCVATGDASGVPDVSSTLDTSQPAADSPSTPPDQIADSDGPDVAGPDVDANVQAAQDVPAPDVPDSADVAVEPTCYPGENCDVPSPPTVDPGGTGGDAAICLLSPTGATPVNLTQGLHLGGFDVSGTTIYAVRSGTVLAGNAKWGSYDCYSAGLCYGSLTCPCNGGTTQCDASTTNKHYCGGTFPSCYSYSSGGVCYAAECGSDACGHPERACHNAVTLEFTVDQTVYRFRALHIAKLLVEPGATVQAGTPIAQVGNTGWTCSQYKTGTGNHGHVELTYYDSTAKPGKQWIPITADWTTWAKASCDEAGACPGGGVCSGHGTCGNGQCKCDVGFQGVACDACDSGYAGYPKCGLCAANFCKDNGHASGTYCDGTSAVTCGTSAGCVVVASTKGCLNGCAAGACVSCPSNFCQDNGHISGTWCSGSASVTCAASGACANVTAQQSCAAGCAAGQCNTPGCTAGDKRRCWLECPQTYPAECLAGNAALVQGVETCAGGNWGTCQTQYTCTSPANLTASCANGSKATTTWQCLDGSSQSDTMTCFQILGGNCTTSFFEGWGPESDCTKLCTGAGDACTTAGATRACEVHCNNASGPVKGGTQTCQQYCGPPVPLVWGPCDTKQACSK